MIMRPLGQASDELVLPSGLWKVIGLTMACVITCAILRVVLARPRRGSVVWVVAVLTLAATCPAFVGSPYRLSLTQSAKGSGSVSRFADLADQFKTASVAGAVAFFMNCGIQSVDADPSALSNAYATQPGAAMPVMEQRTSYQRAPLTYDGVQQQLFMEDFDAARARHIHQVSAPADVRATLADANALQAAKTPARESRNVEATSEEGELAVLEGRIQEEKMRINAAEEHLKVLEEDLQAAKVKKAMQEAAAMELKASPVEADNAWGFRDILLLGVGAVLGAVGHGLVKLKQDWPNWSPPTMPTMPPMPPAPQWPSLTMPDGGHAASAAGNAAVGLAFTASVYGMAPALNAAPVHLNTGLNAAPALPLLTMHKAMTLPDSEASSPSNSPMWGSPFLLQ